MRILYLLTTLLLSIPTTLSQGTNYVYDGSFESVNKHALYKHPASSGKWSVARNAIFVNNADQPNGYTTPFGSQFVQFKHKDADTNSGFLTGSLRKLPQPGPAGYFNLTVSYDYRVFENSNPTCSLRAIFLDSVSGGLLADTLIIPTGNGTWTARTSPKVRSSLFVDRGFRFELECGNFKEQGPFGLDNVKVVIVE